MVGTKTKPFGNIWIKTKKFKKKLGTRPKLFEIFGPKFKKKFLKD